MQIKLSQPPLDAVHDVIKLIQLRCDGCRSSCESLLSTRQNRLITTQANELFKLLFQRRVLDFVVQQQIDLVIGFALHRFKQLAFRFRVQPGLRHQSFEYTHMAQHNLHTGDPRAAERLRHQTDKLDIRCG